MPSAAALVVLLQDRWQGPNLGRAMKVDLAIGNWHKSSHSGNNGCVEVAHGDDVVAVRHSADPSGPVLVFTPQEWRAFLAGVRDGEFDGA